MNIERKIIVIGLICLLVSISLGAAIGTRTITDTSDTFKTTITDSLGNSWPYTWANIQLAINDVNSTDGTVWLPSGTVSGATTLEMNNPISIIGSGQAATHLIYTGTGNAIYIDGLHNYVDGARISDMRIDSTTTAINLTALAPNVITKSFFSNLYLLHVKYGINITCTSVAEVYQNTFENIYVNGVASGGIGINVEGGVYNSWFHVEVINGSGLSWYPTAQAFNIHGAHNRYYSITTNGPIYSAGTLNSWTDVDIEGSAGAHYGTLFNLSGYYSSINGLTFTTCTSNIGLYVSHGRHEIRNVQTVGTTAINYTLDLTATSNGFMENVFANSVFTTQIDSLTGWTFINVTNRTWFNFNSHGFIPMRSTLKPSAPIQGAMFVNTSTGSGINSGDFMYYNGSVWAKISTSALIQLPTTAPPNPFVGSVYMNATTGKIGRYITGGTWVWG